MTREEFLVWATRFPEALLLVQIDGRVLACNDALLAVVGLKNDTVSGQSLFELARGSPTESIRSALRLWSGSGQLVYAPSLDFDKIGKLRCEGAVLKPTRDSNPTVLLVRVKRNEAAAERFVALNATIDRLTHEVHARKRSEEMIRVQREWLHVTLSSIGDAVIATNVEGQIEFLNGAAELLTGWNMKDARGRPMGEVFDIYNEYTGVPVENPVHRVLREGIVVGLANHTVLRAKDGVERPIEDSAAPIRNPAGHLIGVVLVFHDVSEKKKIQAELVESERRFRLWTELNVIAAGVSDLEGTFLEANDALLRLLGQTRNDLLAGKVRGRDVTPPEFHERDQHAIIEAKQGGACQPYEKEFLLKDGRRLPVIVGYALFKAANRYRFQMSEDLAICYIVDISERKRAEELLERRVDERTAKLKEVLADLETFSYTISHDLRAPLRTMRSYSEVLLEDYGASLNQDAQGFLRKIVRSGEHLDTLIRDVLTHTRISKENHQLYPVDLRAFLLELLERYPNFTASGVRIEVSDSMPQVKGNHALLTQCFSNLIGNAIKFVPSGRAPRVRLSGELNGTSARIVVHDNGIGITPEDIQRIFKMFERVHGTDKYEGTGIGLSVVRRAVEKMGGKVGVESELGIGSRFWIELEPIKSGEGQGFSSLRPCP